MNTALSSISLVACKPRVPWSRVNFAGFSRRRTYQSLIRAAESRRSGRTAFERSRQADRPVATIRPLTGGVAVVPLASHRPPEHPDALTPMPWFKKSTSEPLTVAMIGIKLADRVLVVGCSDPPLIAALAIKAGLTGRACAVDSRRGSRGNGGSTVERDGALVESLDDTPDRHCRTRPARSMSSCCATCSADAPAPARAPEIVAEAPAGGPSRRALPRHRNLVTTRSAAASSRGRSTRSSSPAAAPRRC